MARAAKQKGDAGEAGAEVAGSPRKSAGDDYARMVADAIIVQLKAGTAPWQKPWEPASPFAFMPHNAATGRPYRGANAMWLLCVAQAKGYADPRWMTYRQAESIGAQVRRGEKSTRVQYWLWEGEEPERDEKGRVKRDGDGEVVMVRVRYERPRVFTAAVFNGSQMDGIAPLAPPPPARWERHERSDALLTASGAVIRHVHGDSAHYSRVTDDITMPDRGQFPTADAYYQTALHELAHWTGAPTRLARDMDHPFGSPGYAREELRAEIASLMLGGELGVGHDPSRCAAYVQSWIKALEEDPREIFRAASDSEKARAFVLERERKLERGTDAPVVVQDAAERVASAGAEGRSGVGNERRYLVVPYEEKDALKEAAKAAGTWARWDKAAKSWYVPADVDTAPFERWLAPRQVALDPAAEFGEALRAAGLRVEGAAVMDGELHRVPVEDDKPGEKSGAYRGFLDDRPAGWIQNFKTGLKDTWTSSAPTASITPAEREALKAAAETKLAERAAARERQHRAAAERAAAVWEKAAPVEGTAHPYLARKGVPSHGLRLDPDGNLLVPVLNAEGQLQSLQKITDEGRKTFFYQSTSEGGMMRVAPPGTDESGRTVLLAEGYATAVTVAEATGLPVYVAFNAGNLASVAAAVRARHPEAVLCIAADNDRGLEAKGDPNVGRVKAEEAAKAVGAHVFLPEFTGLTRVLDQNAADKGSDWNDLAAAIGREEVRALLCAGVERAVQLGARAPADPSLAAAETPGVAPVRRSIDGLGL